MFLSYQNICLRPSRSPVLDLYASCSTHDSRSSFSVIEVNVLICATVGHTMPSPKPDSPNSPSNLEAPTNVLTTDNPIVADEAGFGDDDGGYNSDQASTSSTSISSSIRNHTFEDGIRYHRFHDGQYAFPNDENEQNRDDMKHAMTLLLCNQKLHFAPIGDSPQRIIDLGRW